MLGLWAAVGCSSGESADEIETQLVPKNEPEAKLVVAASVLIAELPDQPSVPIETIRVNPATVVVDPGETVELSARAFGPGGEPVEDVEFVWSTTDARAGTVSKDGTYLSGRRPGTFDSSISVTGIQNTPQGVEFANAFASIVIVGEEFSRQIDSVTIIPESPTLYTKQIFRLRAVAYDADGIIIPGVDFVWTLNEPTLGEINSLGLLTVKATEGVFEDAVSVAGVWEGVTLSSASDVRVTAAPQEDDFLAVHALPQRFFVDPGDQLQLRAVALNGLGELVAGTQLRWEMVNDVAGTIDGSGNFVAGPYAGIYTESVRVEAIVPGEQGFVRAADFASVVIRDQESSRRLHTLAAIPGTVALDRGGSMVLAAKAVDESGEPVKNVSFFWKVTNENIGELNEFGTFKAGDKPGIYRDALVLTAEQLVDDEVLSQTKKVDVVISGSLFRAEVLPSLVTVAPGRMGHFSVTGWDDNDIKLSGLVVIWRVNDDRVGSIDPFGNFTAGTNPGLYEDVIRAEVIQKRR